MLIGNVLQGNIYTNNSNYVNHLGTLVNPNTKISDMSAPSPLPPQTNANDFRPLNFPGPDPVHPHSSVAGLRPGRDLFPVGPTQKMHDGQFAFLNNNVSVDPKNAVQTPMAKRTEIYSPSTIIPSDIQQQLHGPIVPDNVKYSKNYGPQVPSDVLNAALTREEIYAKSDDNIRHNQQLPDVTLNAQSLKNNLYNNDAMSLVNGGKYGFTEALPGPLDVFAIAHWVRNIGSEVMFLPKFVNDPVTKQGSFQGPVRSTPPGGPNGAETVSKSAKWLASNLLLASLNTGDMQAYGPLNLVWNPLSLLTAMLPARGISPTEAPTLGNIASNYKTNLEASVLASQASSMNPLGERLLVIRNGLYSQVAPVKRLQQLRSPIAPPGFVGTLNGKLTTIDDEININTAVGVPGSIDMIMDSKTDQAWAGGGVHTNLYNEGRKYGQDTAAYPLDKLENDFVKLKNAGFDTADLKVEKLFTSKPFPGAGGLNSGKDLTFVAKPFATFINKRGFSDIQDTPENVDVAFSVLDETDGTVDSTIDDDKNYMPFMFQDLRDEKNQFLYIRAFLKSLSETLTPEWNEDRYYGRVEPVPIYKGTMRTLNLSFDMVAWGPKDLRILYKKLQKLQSMVYPLYDEQGFLKSGPVIKLRVGDIISAGSGLGLPGYLTAMDFNYDKAIWNIKKDFKVPRNIEVSLGFTVLHQANPGLYKDPKLNKIVFGTANFVKDNDSFKIDGSVSEENIRQIFKSVKSS